MISIIYPYRNRDLQRLKNSLDSLQSQISTAFEVFFIDYGSESGIAKTVEKLVSGYEFADYKFHPTRDQPWNKSRALNSVIKDLTTDFCFVADVDMIFSPEFVGKTSELKNIQKAYYFQTGFLDAKETFKARKFDQYRNYRKSNDEVTGLTLFPVKALQELRGFDEFYHFWGAEDTDMHVRLKNAGYEVEFYDKKILMLHQWHESYQSSERSDLSGNLQLSGIIQLNHQHLKFTQLNKVTKVNFESWGKVMNQNSLEELEELPVTLNLNSERGKIEDLLYGQLPVMKGRSVKIRVTEDPYQESVKFRIKKMLGKKVPEFYSLKEINDLVLLHLISFYRDRPYIFKVGEDLKSITFCIKL